MKTTISVITKKFQINLKLTTICYSIALLCILQVSGQNITKPKIACPYGLWVNSYNGVLYFERSDISTTGRGMPLQVSFYYNSSASSINKGTFI